MGFCAVSRHGGDVDDAAIKLDGLVEKDRPTSTAVGTALLNAIAKGIEAHYDEYGW